MREIGASFNTALAYRDPTEQIVHDNYMIVRKHLDFLKSWIDDRLADISSGRTTEPEKTFGWYWIKNSEGSEHFNHKDVVFECFHNFVAFSQWGNSLYNVMTKLIDDPHGGSRISALAETSEPVIERHSFIINPHTSTSHDPVQWTNPDDFDPAKTFEVKDGRKAALHNSAFGTVFGVADGRPLPVCDYAGFAPFGFGYRRCPGEQLTVMAFEDLIRKACKDRLSFGKTGGGDPKQVPIGPTTVIGDDMGFRRLS